MLEKVISGGQIGIDCLGLSCAMQLGIPIGGWVPKGFRAEREIPAVYRAHMQETPGSDYQTRTGWNIRDSDATLLVYFSLPLSSGSRLTASCAKRTGKPLVEVYIPELRSAVEPRLTWSKDLVDLKVLNIAGPRYIPPELEAFTMDTVLRLLRAWRLERPSPTPQESPAQTR